MVKRIRKKPGTGKSPVLKIILIALAALAGGYWLYTGLYPDTLRFNYIVITRDGKPLKILNGETIRLHPSEKIRITSISTNILRNFGVRLYSGKIDINSLLYDEATLSELLPGKEMFNRYAFPAVIKRDTREMGKINFIIEPFVEDWVDKARRTIESEKKISILVRALELGYEDRQIKIMLADEYIAAKNWKKASALLEKIVEESGDDKSIMKLLEVYEATRDTGKIISILEPLIDRNPDDPDLRVRVASAYERAGKTKNAINEYKTLAKMLPEESRVQVFKTMGFLYSKIKQNKNAVDAYLKALKIDSSDVNLYYNISALYDALGDSANADKYLSKAVDMKSDDVESRLKLSENLIKRKQYTKARGYLDQILKKKPKSLEAWYLIAGIAEKRGDKKGLKSAYEKILSISPGSRTVIFNLGVLEYEAGNYKTALGYFVKYLSLNPGDIDAREFLYDIYIKQKNEKLAYEQARRILDYSPNKTEYYGYIFNYLNRIKAYKTMRSVMSYGLKKRPNDNEIKKYHIIASLNTGNEKEAQSIISDLLKSEPDDVSTLMQLAGIYEKIGNRDKAMETYKKIISLSPENENARESYRRLTLEVLK